MSGSNDGKGGGWGDKFLKVASAAATAAAVAGGLYAMLSSSSRQEEVPFGAPRQREERDEDYPSPPPRFTPLQDTESLVIGWERPEIGWVKLNVDGSRDHFNTPSAGCGGVLRDSSGEWIRGFAQKLNPDRYQAHRTELQAILTGVIMASKMNLKKLIVESDSDSAVNMVENVVNPNHPDYDLVQRIRSFKRHCFDWQVKFLSVSNKANRVADRLANDARKLPSDYDFPVEYTDPPVNCLQLLLDDQEGCESF